LIDLTVLWRGAVCPSGVAPADADCMSADAQDLKYGTSENDWITERREAMRYGPLRMMCDAELVRVVQAEETGDPSISRSAARCGGHWLDAI